MKAKTLTRETISAMGSYERNFPDFEIGDTIAVSQRIKEGDKERLQIFEGDVIAMHKNGIATTFTVRRIGANGIGVEKIFPHYSPTVSEVKLIKSGKVRRAKLFYVRERLGKAARIKERILTKSEKALSAKKPAAKTEAA